MVVCFINELSFNGVSMDKLFFIIFLFCNGIKWVKFLC